MAKYFNPVKIQFGLGEISNIAFLLSSTGDEKEGVLLLTGSKSLEAAGHLDILRQMLQGWNYRIVDGIPPNPDLQDFLLIREKTVGFDYNFILAVGGGSVIDTGKALAALKAKEVETPGDLRKGLQQQQQFITGDLCPLMAVPTTAGTGSEVTSWATLWDKELKLKYSLESPGLYPKYAVIDPQLTLNLPVPMTASSALDALSHATEAYWSKNSNEIVRMYALRSISYIAGNLEELLEKPGDLSLREKVAYGSLFAGLAFSNTKTTACHSISYPLTLFHDLNHGIAASLTLGRMLMKNETYIAEKEELFRAYNVTGALEVQEFVERVFRKAGLPCRLRDYGISGIDLDTIAEKSFTPGRMDNNPVDLDRQFILGLLKSIY